MIGKINDVLVNSWEPKPHLLAIISDERSHYKRKTNISTLEVQNNINVNKYDTATRSVTTAMTWPAVAVQMYTSIMRRNVLISLTGCWAFSFFTGSREQAAGKRPYERQIDLFSQNFSMCKEKVREHWWKMIKLLNSLLMAFVRGWNSCTHIEVTTTKPAKNKPSSYFTAKSAKSKGRIKNDTLLEEN